MIVITLIQYNVYACLYVYIKYAIIMEHTGRMFIYVRNLLGWLETRLAQNTLN